MHRFLGGDLTLPLGEPAPGYELESGPRLGVRGARWLGPRVVIEAELSVLSTRFRNAPGQAIVISSRGGFAYETGGGKLRVRVVGGAGAHSLVTSSAGTHLDTDFFVDWGAALTLPVGDRATVRLDLRDELAAGVDGLSHGFDITLGVMIYIRRR